MLTKQEMFDKVAVHMLTQKAQAMNGFKCMYRADNGLTCAAGCLLSDEDYDLKLESGTVLSEINKPTFIKLVGEHNLNALRELQRIHDITPVEYWYDALIAFARFDDLSDEVIVAQFGRKN